MLPVMVIVGRPNVGKSTLFNILTRTRDALVADMPGVTRDRQYGEGVLGDRPYLVVDTGGIAEINDPEMSKLTDIQVTQAINDADVLLFMVDAKLGLTAGDEMIANRLRDHAGKVVLLVNKVDSDDANVASSEFYQLGFMNVHAISATRGRGVKTLISHVLEDLPEAEDVEPVDAGTRIAIVGRPNVGKSTLTNRMLGEERVIVFDRPGTTRDSIFIPFERRDKKYTLIDTAGIRRRTKVKEAVEKFSIIKTMRAVERAHVVVMVMNAQEGITDQDLRLLGIIIKMGKPLVVAINKWDGLGEDERTQIKQTLERRLQFATFARRYFISALHGSGVGMLYHAVDEADQAVRQEMSTSRLTQILMQAVKNHQPPLVRNRRIKLRYAHLGGKYPLTVIVHGKQTESLPNSYQRYLANYFREAFQLTGVPLILRFKSDENPYEKK